MRLVSLCPSITETLIDLGLASSLVGITRFCIHPAKVVRDLPKVGGTKTPDLDAIRAARPDLVFMNAEENRVEDHTALAGELRVDVSFPRTVAEVPGLIRHFGALTGTEGAAEQRASELEAAIADARTARTVFRYAYLIWRDPYMAAGGGTYVSDLFALAGGINLLADSAVPYPSVELGTLRSAGVVLLSDEPYPFSEKHVPEIASAVAPANVRLISGDDCCWHGVRSIRGVRLVAQLGRALDTGA